MTRVLSPLLLISTLVFLVSSVIYAISPTPEEIVAASSEPASYYRIPGNLPPAGLADPLLRPDSLSLWLLLIVVWAATGVLGWNMVRKIRRGRRRATTGQALPLVMALLVGAAWPWLSAATPTAAFIGSAVMLLGLVAASIRGPFLREPRVRPAAAVAAPEMGIFTGWATVLTFAVFANYTSRELGLPIGLTAFVALVLCCTAAAVLQLHMPENPAYTITVIYAFLGIAATMITEGPIISVLAVMGIAAMTFVLVRVTT